MSTAELHTKRWSALANRKEVLPTGFIYAVLTTGIYCRPECSSRLPLKENVRFFDGANAAREAGFRACKRCCPDDAELCDKQRTAVESACRLLEASPTELNLNELAASVGISPSHFHRLFRSFIGVTPKQYSVEHRARRARELLNGDKSVTEAFYGAGFGYSGRFYSDSRKLLGLTPKQFVAGGKGERLQFAVGECSLGSILVAATARGVCWIALGDEPDLLLKEFQNRFHAAELVGDDLSFERVVARVVTSIEQQRPDPRLALDIRGTAFQLRVWSALNEIAPGAPVSYGELATRVGSPDAVRAVANACASNTLAVLIPCHRVVRTDGSLSGYRWGVERKAALLEREKNGAGATARISRDGASLLKS